VITLFRSAVAALYERRRFSKSKTAVIDRRYKLGYDTDSKSPQKWVRLGSFFLAGPLFSITYWLRSVILTSFFSSICAFQPHESRVDSGFR
jgi:hypothetical protein